MMKLGGYNIHFLKMSWHLQVKQQLVTIFIVVTSGSRRIELIATFQHVGSLLNNIVYYNSPPYIVSVSF